MTLHFSGTDPNAGQTTQLYADVEHALPGATFTTSTTGEATLQWQTTAQTRLGFYRFPVTVVDNSSPQRGFETRIITVRVVNTILSTSDAQKNSNVAAYPIPFTEQVTIRLVNSGRRQVTIVDALGRTVAELTTQADGVVRWRPTAVVAPGLYIARTADGQSKRLVRVAP
ncbi:T9SS type A sorting domain-containing protein [Hymenobacter aerilatus]|uniref:T9SS type A sorting domain-containing protein n=1 Tax=Hymenobacter aerilatus TaxID=2932251 RepID=A0A8T9SX81_9BACT|nr:T9SS type A sorting domain-containing protein [Hymenobacter aerilatus]UOR05554.1 T9SS type A sorting domain-containing protein [Hymenobacter aerilatus]